MTQLYLLSNSQRYTPICQLTPAYAKFALIFIVRRFYVVSAAAMAFSYCHTLGQGTAHYSFAIQLAIPQATLGINCIRLPRPHDFYDIRSGGRLVAASSVIDG
jgi:hypothetical protein